MEIEGRKFIDAVVTIHNMFQVATWYGVLHLLYIDKFDFTLWQDDEDFRFTV